MAALSEEQSIIRDQAKNWVSSEAPVQKFRQVRDTQEPLNYAPDTWAAMAEMGWPGILVPEAHGGSDLGYLTFGLILEETGRQLTASPLFASAYAAATALIKTGNEAQQAKYLPQIADGSVVATLALDEGTRHNPKRLATMATANDAGFVISGQKSFVMEAQAANLFVVSARTSGAETDVDGQSLFLLSADADGVEVDRLATVDSRGFANVNFNDVQVSSDDLLGEAGACAPQIETILDCCRAGIAAEMLGTASQAFEMTLEYLKTREQFGRVIGSFQALGHRAATLFTQMELARSCVEAALKAVDEDSDELPRLASLAKCRMGDFLHEMSNQLIQIHGGIGMTDEFDAGFYLKRARVLEAAFGNQGYHRDRYARLQGF